jgi:hypothetical protein
MQVLAAFENSNFPHSQILVRGGPLVQRRQSQSEAGVSRGAVLWLVSAWNSSGEWRGNIGTTRAARSSPERCGPLWVSIQFSNVRSSPGAARNDRYVGAVADLGSARGPPPYSTYHPLRVVRLGAAVVLSHHVGAAVGGDCPRVLPPGGPCLAASTRSQSWNAATLGIS